MKSGIGVPCGCVRIGAGLEEQVHHLRRTAQRSHMQGCLVILKDLEKKEEKLFSQFVCSKLPSINRLAVINEKMSGKIPMNALNLFLSTTPIGIASTKPKKSHFTRKMLMEIACVLPKLGVGIFRSPKNVQNLSSPCINKLHNLFTPGGEDVQKLGGDQISKKTFSPRQPPELKFSKGKKWQKCKAPCEFEDSAIPCGLCMKT